MKIDVVIGAQFGDEGKGLVTDYLARPDHSLVMRFNGGAQAGHTVVLPNGERHEFHHFGAGTFRNCQTALSRHFVVNPALFISEWRAIKQHQPHIAIDPRALVTTPYDMLINRAVEEKRGMNRHGSCGLGINETVTRNTRFPLTVNDVLSPGRAKACLRLIQQDWVPLRCEELGVFVPAMCRDNNVFDRAQDDLVQMFRRSFIAYDTEMLDATDHVVFEGAQGLRLDEKNGVFPHVTRSRTGLTNVVELVNEMMVISKLNIYYVTRTYVTRHGAGPLEGEVAEHPYGWKGPETNVLNPWQGVFRYGYLRLEDLAESIRLDLESNPSKAGVAPRLAVTCLDQVPENLRTMPDMIADVVGIPVGLTSSGETRNTVNERTIQPEAGTAHDAWTVR